MKIPTAPSTFLFTSGAGGVNAVRMYRSLAAATTFSPRFHAVLSEAVRSAKYFGSSLQLIHAGEETAQKKAQITAGLRLFDLSDEVPVHWVPGEPAATIARVAIENHCDLIIAGAVHDDSGYRPFANNIARQLLADAPIDLFLFLQPAEGHATLQCPAVIIDFTDTSAQALREIEKVAKTRGAEKIHAIQVITTFDEHRLRASGDQCDAEDRLDQFVLDTIDLEMPVETKCVRGNTGFAACEYLQAIGADLLVVPTRMPGGKEPVLSPNLDWLYQVIPCNLWVMRGS